MPSTGRPIITSDIPGCREAVTAGSGYLCPARNAEAIAEAMMRFAALSPDDRSRMGAAARDHIAASFDKKLVVKKTIDYLGITNG